MSTRIWKGLGALALLLATAAMATMVGKSARAQAADEEPNGRIVEISPDESADLPAAENERPAAAPKYWIGLAGRPIASPALRTHLQLADDVGVLVEQIVPDSPAEKAGLRQHDVIVAVNGEPISDLRALQEVVTKGDDKPIELKIIRLAKEETVSVTPEERPADAPSAAPAAPGVDGMNDIEGLLRQFQQQGAVPGGVRVFGPGMVLGGQAFNPNNVPSGVSVSITRQEDGPAEITVKKGDQTWKLKSNDEEALKKLPDDVRPFVEQMLEGTRPGQPGRLGAMQFDFGDLEGILPENLDLDAFGVDQQQLQKRADEVRKRTESASQELLKRMEEMEQRMQELQRQFEENSDQPRTNGDDDSSST
ncbi:MAG TPA: PDZ domain-containing protein [Lacipirellula sp.]